MIGPYILDSLSILPLVSAFNLDRELLALFSSAGIRFSVVFALILILLKSQNTTYKSTVFSLIIGALVLGMSLDQGVYLTVAAIIVMITHYFIFAEKNKILQMTIKLFTMWAFWLLAVLILSRLSLTAVIEILKFYFVELPGDQRWFFATWPSDTVISWRGLLKPLGPLIIILTSVFIVSIREASKYRFSTSSLIAGQILSVYAIFSTIPFLMSYKGNHYLIPAYLTIPIVMSLMHSHVTLRKSHFLMNKPRTTSEVLDEINHIIKLEFPEPITSMKLTSRTTKVLIFSVALVLVSAPAGIAKLVSKSTSLAWQQDIRAYSTLALDCKNSTNFWSDYPGYFMARSGCKLPTGDLMIHALGDRREKYQKDFMSLQPRYVETATAESLMWAPWLRTTNWDFYKFLYDQYSPIANTSHSILWEKDRTLKTKLQFIAKNDGLKLYVPVPTVVTPPKNARVGYLRISYKIDQPLNYLPLIGTLGNYGLRINGSVYPGEIISLSPKKNYAEFPIFINKSTEVIEITPIYNSPRFFAALRVKNASITWLAPLQNEIANFETSLK
jgi:hypothetical protein